MPVRRGQDWGSTGPLADGAPIASSDAELAAIVAEASDQRVEVGLVAGDLARTVGARGTVAQLRSDPDRTRLPIDMGEALIDGAWHLFAAHLVIRTRSWSGEIDAVMNAAFFGDWNAAPRGHPNDGRLDLIEARLSLADRLKARPRLPSGAHVPHPDISIRRVKQGEIRPQRAARVYLDASRLGAAHSVEFRVRPDAVTIVI